METIKANKESLSEVKKILVDGGYGGEPFKQAIKEEIGAEVEIVKRNELHKFTVQPKRWIVERSFGWLEKCRRLWKNCERYITTSRQMIVLVFIKIMMLRFCLYTRQKWGEKRSVLTVREYSGRIAEQKTVGLRPGFEPFLTQYTDKRIDFRQALRIQPIFGESSR